MSYFFKTTILAEICIKLRYLYWKICSALQRWGIRTQISLTPAAGGSNPRPPLTFPSGNPATPTPLLETTLVSTATIGCISSTDDSNLPIKLFSGGVAQLEERRASNRKVRNFTCRWGSVSLYSWGQAGSPWWPILTKTTAANRAVFCVEVKW